MRGLVQRVLEASVTVDGADGDEVVGSIGRGLCVLVGVTHDDNETNARKLADKIWGLRVMDDDEGVMNRSIADTGGEVLIVSQFTLYGDTRRGNRPSFVEAAPPEEAEALYERVRSALGAKGGVFGARMAVSLVNDGPVTLMLE